MSGVLQFSLGLTAGGFASALAGASGKLKSFVGSALAMPGVGLAVGGLVGSFASLHAVIEGVMGAFETGAGLEKLAKQTGESVGTLYQLQKALSAVDVESAKAGPMIFAMQRALGGVSENGEPTAHIFSQLGLSIDELKGMDAPAALGAIGAKLGQLDAASATNAAGKIFGRQGAAEFLLVARSAEEFTEALQKNQQVAAMYQRAAGSFDAIDKNLERIRGKAKGMFVGIAVGLAPALENITNALNKIDLTGIGEDIGKMFGSLSQAFADGNISELISASVAAGTERATAIFTRFGQEMVAIIQQTIGNPSLWSGVLSVIVGSLAPLGNELRKNLNKAGLGIAETVEQFVRYDPTDPTQSRKIHKRYEAAQQAHASRLDAESSDAPGLAKDGMAKIAGVFNGVDMKGALQRISQAVTTSGPAAQSLSALVSDLQARYNQVSRLTPGAGKNYQNPVQSLDAGAGYERQRTNLEKMGFVMGGGGASGPAEQTARNTKASLDFLRQIAENSKLKTTPNLANATVA